MNSRQNILHHVPMHIGQPEAAALVFERELRVVDAELVEDRGLQVVHMHGAGREGFFRG